MKDRRVPKRTEKQGALKKKEKELMKRDAPERKGLGSRRKAHIMVEDIRVTKKETIREKKKKEG